MTVVEVGQFFMTKDTEEFSQFTDTVVSTLCQETKIRLNRRVGSDETPKFDPNWKLQFVAYKVNMVSRSQLCL